MLQMHLRLVFRCQQALGTLPFVRLWNRYDEFAWRGADPFGFGSQPSMWRTILVYIMAILFLPLTGIPAILAVPILWPFVGLNKVRTFQSGPWAPSPRPPRGPAPLEVLHLPARPRIHSLPI